MWVLLLCRSVEGVGSAVSAPPLGPGQYDVPEASLAASKSAAKFSFPRSTLDPLRGSAAPGPGAYTTAGKVRAGMARVAHVELACPRPRPRIPTLSFGDWRLCGRKGS